MSIDDVQKRLEAIREWAADGDYEAAHGWEDELRNDVLTAIATGKCSGCCPEDLAAEVLKSSEIDFARHCA